MMRFTIVGPRATDVFFSQGTCRAKNSWLTKPDLRSNLFEQITILQWKLLSADGAADSAKNYMILEALRLRRIQEQQDHHDRQENEGKKKA